MTETSFPHTIHEASEIWQRYIEQKLCETFNLCVK